MQWCIDLITITQLGGSKSLCVVKRYTAPTTGCMKEAVRRL